MSEIERQTRKKRIDARLRELRWEVLPYDPNVSVDTYTHHAVEEYPTRSGPCDYALFYQGKIIGIVEAKRLSLGPQNVLVQAQRYAKGIFESPFNFRGFKVPFIYSTNGEVIWFQDLREEDGYSRRISNFHTPEALGEMLDRDLRKDCCWFAENPNQHPKLRYYQIEATKTIEEAISKGRRKIFIAMATGSGKTYTMVSQVYRLIKSGVGRRILFLVDRRALAAQAVLAFKFADEVEKRVKNARDRLEKITQSVLSKAFRGELTQDFRQAVKNWKNLSLKRRKKYLFTLSEKERYKALYSDKFPLEPASVLLSCIQESKQREKKKSGQLRLWEK